MEGNSEQKGYVEVPVPLFRRILVPKTQRRHTSQDTSQKSLLLPPHPTFAGSRVVVRSDVDKSKSRGESQRTTLLPNLLSLSQSSELRPILALPCQSTRHLLRLALLRIGKRALVARPPTFQAKLILASFQAGNSFAARGHVISTGLLSSL